MTITLYHNPRCSKSRQALALLEERGVSPEVVLYLETPPDAVTLKCIIDKLGIPARQLLRTGEEEYRQLELANPALTDQQLMAAMCAHPRLIERPVAIRGNRAVIGRPPENILTLL